jgi:hypothetical protein
MTLAKWGGGSNEESKMKSALMRRFALSALFVNALLSTPPASAGLLDDIRANPGGPIQTTVDRGPAPGSTDVSDLGNLPDSIIPDETSWTSCRVIATAVIPKRAVVTCAEGSVVDGAPLEFSLPVSEPEASLALQLAETARFAGYLGTKRVRLVGRLSEQGVLKEAVSLQGTVGAGGASMLMIEYVRLGGSIADAACGGPCNVVVSMIANADPDIAKPN